MDDAPNNTPDWAVRAAEHLIAMALGHTQKTALYVIAAVLRRIRETGRAEGLEEQILQRETQRDHDDAIANREPWE